MPHYIEAGEAAKPKKKRRREEREYDPMPPGPWRTPLPLLCGCTAEHAARIRAREAR